MKTDVTNRRTYSDDKYDYYATDPKALRMLLEVEEFSKNIWEPACGEGHLSDVLKENNYNVISSDVVDRGYQSAKVIDFLEFNKVIKGTDIITNPPFNKAIEFIMKAQEVLEDGKIAMFLKLTFLETKKRKELFEKYPPKVIYIMSGRIECAKDGIFTGGSAVAYIWVIWEKDYKGETVMKWL